MSDVRKSLEFAATSSGWSRAQLPDWASHPSLRLFALSVCRRSKRAYFKRTVINLSSLLVRCSGTKQEAWGRAQLVGRWFSIPAP